ncbi:uncharacterized protein B0H18DRAFT_1212281 [Fomitopsis serialis]|uniref:uncharacterized protein n=1 Tax=Fomitopsis serialis TaxID=139415 RepID=UPI002008446A|nr:uncharacterized protein B0H18DRAFT_1212281 [Neoantrodia serialis]KAH9923212.1 hypothetical protein B0H18DRAFT_1212281 [Neoantrodia serialis]
MATTLRKIADADSEESNAPLPPVAPMVEPRDAIAGPVRGQMQEAVFSAASSIVLYIGDALRDAFWLLKKPLGILIFILALTIACDYVAGKLGGILCLIPGMTSSMFCTRYASAPIDVDINRKPLDLDLDKLVGLHGKFEDVMTTNVGTDMIQLKLKQSEIATRNLVILVRNSDLRSRDALAEALLQFLDDAKKAGEGLIRLTKGIDGAVNRIAAANEFALRTMEAATAESSSLSRLVTALLFRSTTKAIVAPSYREVMETLAHETDLALLQASASAASLERLEETLDTIHAICSREGLSLSRKHAELLSELWTILGGNRDLRRSNEMQLALLKDIDWYRTQALTRVVVTRDVLLMMTVDVEELRDQAATPHLVGERVPVEALIDGIGRSIEGLKEGRRRANEMQEDAATCSTLVDRERVGLMPRVKTQPTDGRRARVRAQADEWTGGLVDGRAGGLAGRKTNGQTSGQEDGRAGRRAGRKTGGQEDGRVGRRTDEPKVGQPKRTGRRASRQASEQATAHAHRERAGRMPGTQTQPTNAHADGWAGGQIGAQAGEQTDERGG